MGLHAVLRSPIGELVVAATPRGVCWCGFAEDWPEARARLEATVGGQPFREGAAEGVLREALVELTAYFETRRHPVAPLDLAGTAFQRACWRALAAIPFGAVQTYTGVARAVGRPGAARAVGAACAANPVAIFVPCHRVVGSGGLLVGYGGGLWRKEWLLRHERRAEGASAPQDALVGAPAAAAALGREAAVVPCGATVPPRRRRPVGGAVGGR
jgi:O-6-methylguanine DNA methyltransferase